MKLMSLIFVMCHALRIWLHFNRIFDFNVKLHQPYSFGCIWDDTLYIWFVLYTTSFCSNSHSILHTHCSQAEQFANENSIHIWVPNTEFDKRSIKVAWAITFNSKFNNSKLFTFPEFKYCVAAEMNCLVSISRRLPSEFIQNDSWSV